MSAHTTIRLVPLRNESTARLATRSSISLAWYLPGKRLHAESALSLYVYQAHEAGYATFRYDRLGTGQSERPADGYNLAQANTEVAILENLAERIRNTTDIGGKSWNQTLVVGHSYGSAQAQRLSQLRPELIDALVLTGFSLNATGFPFILLSGVHTQAGTIFPDRFANISKHWLVTGTPYAAQMASTFPASTAENATNFVREIEQPVTQGAFFSIGAIVAPAPNYTGPVQIVLGERDFVFAFSNPFSVPGPDLATAALQELYPQAAAGSVGTIIPATGHGLNYHTTASISFNATLSFLNQTLFGNNGTSTGGSGANATAPLPSVSAPSQSGSVVLPTTTVSA
ncbi:hypothetical protein V8E36_000249 [Tilletia maclaganii]